MDARNGMAALLVAAGLLAGCSSHSGKSAVDDSGHTVRAGDPAYALSALRQAPAADELVTPATLAESLPNHHLELGDTGRVSSFSDAVVVGRVTNVVKGHGVIWRDDDDFTVVGYDDPKADTRTVYVTVAVDHSVGRIDAPTVTFRVLVPFATDAQRFVGGLAGLGRVAVVLHDDPNRAEDVSWRPIMDDSLIAVVADDGSLTLPALGRGRAFAGDLDTVGRLLAAARAPETTTTVAVP